MARITQVLPRRQPGHAPVGTDIDEDGVQRRLDIAADQETLPGTLTTLSGGGVGPMATR